MTGAVTLADTAQLTISKDTFVNLASADLGSDTKLNVTGAFNDSASADSLGKVTGTGTLSVILRSGGTNYSKVTLSDDFSGTFEFSGNWALAGSSEGTAWQSNWKNDANGPTFKIQSGGLFTQGGSAEIKNAIEFVGSGTLQPNAAADVLTLSGAITGASGVTLTKQGSGTVVLASSLENYKGSMQVTAGTLSMKAEAWSTFAQGVNISGGTLTLEKTTDATSKVVATQLTADGGKLVFDGDVQVENTIQSGKGAATLTARQSGGVATYSHVTVDSFNKIKANDEASAAKIFDANLAITKNGDFAIENLELVNSLVKLQNAGTLTLTNVTLGAGSALERVSGSTKTFNMVRSGVVLGSENLTTSEGTSPVGLSYSLVGARVSESLTLGLTDELMKQIGSWAAGSPYNTVDITLTDVGAWSLTAGDIQFDAYTGSWSPVVTNDPALTGRTVVISVSFGRQIPEPATAALSFAAVLGLLLRRRRRVEILA